MLTIQEISKSTASWWILRLDNVQHYVRPRHLRIGREASMKIGCAATLFGFQSYTPIAVDIAKKQECIARNERKTLTFERLHSLINYDHLDQVCTLQILRTLIHYVPSLQKHTGIVQQMYDTIVAIHRLPVCKTQIYPLPTNGRNETVTSELLQALLDFVQVMGFTEDEPLTHLLFTGGDGLTYERMVLLKLYMQFHESSFERLEWLKPFLETWHTSWTDLSRIYEAHWDSLGSPDPSTLGHSANHIRRKAPSNVKKVDYYPYSQLLYQVLDARILDCCRYGYLTYT